VKNYLFYTDDKNFILSLEKAFPSQQLKIKQVSLFPQVEPKIRAVVIDGDSLPPHTSLPTLHVFKRKKIPVVFLFTSINGKNAIELLNNGVIAIFFKDYSMERIKNELNHLYINFNYLEKVKEIAENENRTKRFLNVVSSLTSDNDINKIMNDILKSMLEVFKLESSTFFILKQDRLKLKIELGRSRKSYIGTEWDINNPQIKWLAEIQYTRKPIYITKKSKREYKRYFPENTLLLPLTIKDVFFGLIAATLRPEAKTFSRNEIALLKAFAAQTALALENAKLYWDVIQTQEQLVNQEKKTLLNQTILSLNHEINNPLSVISMEAQLLQQKLGKNEHSIEARVIRIEQNTERIKKILEKISSLSTESLPITDYIEGRKMLNLHDN